MSIAATRVATSEANSLPLHEKHPYRDDLPLINYGEDDHAISPQQRGIRPGNKLVKALKTIFVPSFFRAGPKCTKRPNAGLMALDGLRGLACLAVVNQRES